MASNKVKFLTSEELSKRFTPAQRRLWPTRYRPSTAVAPLLRHSVTEASSAYAPTSLAALIAARKSLQSASARAMAAGPDDGSAAAAAKVPVLSTPEAAAASGAASHDYSMAGSSPLARDVPRNQRVHLEAAFLDFVEGRDEAWLGARYDGVEGGVETLLAMAGVAPSSSSSSAKKKKPKLPWRPMSVARRQRTLKRITARDRSTLPSFVEMAEFLNLPMPYDTAGAAASAAASHPAAPSPSASDLPAEEQLEQFLRAIPEELPCDIEITDYKKKGNRMSPAAGTVGLQMGSDPSQAPRPVNIAPVDSSAAVGTYRHSMEQAIRVHEREVARAGRAAKQQQRAAAAADADGSSSSPSLPSPPRFYDFTPFAAQQERSLAPLEGCESLDDTVLLPTFSHLRDILHLDYFNAFGVGNYLASITGDGLVLTAEFVTELAMYLARRWHEMAAEMGAKHASSSSSSSSSDAAPLCPKPGPILLPLGNGRLAYHLNATGILPVRCYATSRHSEGYLYPTAMGALASIGGDAPQPGKEGFGAVPYPFPSAFFNTSTIRNKSFVANCPLSRSYSDGADGGGGADGGSNSNGGNSNSRRASSIPFGQGPMSSGAAPGEAATEASAFAARQRYEAEREARQKSGEWASSVNDDFIADLPPIPGVDVPIGGYYDTAAGGGGGVGDQQQKNNNASKHFGSDPTLDPSFFASRYPITTEVSVSDALHVYRPSIVIAEPHAARDYAADMRGCPSVQEVLFIGPIDGPAMGSFSFPWLTFGVSPAPDTFNLYNDHFQLQGRGGGGMGGMGGGRMQMPMDPPYMAQGYRRVYLDRISALTILPNDSAEVPRQGRCLAFRRL